MPVHFHPSVSLSRRCTHRTPYTVYAIQLDAENMYILKDGFESRKQRIDVNNQMPGHDNMLPNGKMEV